MNGAICTRVARYLSGRPLYIEPVALKSMLDAVGPRLGLRAESEESGPSLVELKRAAALQRLSSIETVEPVQVADGMGEYGLTVDGVAIVPVLGALVDRFDWLSALCGFVSYDGLKATLAAIENDGRVKAAILDIDSPGGEAAGMLDCADRIRALNSRKPVWACANSLAASAAYALSAAAGRITLPRLAAVGSIGVVAVHVDQSGADKERGLKFTALYSGARKIDGWGHAALSDDARKGFQAQLDEARRKFAEAVAGFRGLQLDEVLATEAATFDDDAGVAAGLADAVMPFDQTLAELTERVRSGGSTSRGTAARHPAMNGDTRMAKETPAAMPKATTEDETKPVETPPADTPPATEPEKTEPEKKPAEPAAASDSMKRADAAELVVLCTEAGVPLMAAQLLKEGATLEQAKARIDGAGKIKALVVEARKVNASIPAGLADDLIKSGASVETARASLFDQLVGKQSEEIRPHTTATTTDKPADDGWGAAVAKVNARNGFVAKA